MTDKTYILRFIHSDGSEIEEQEYIHSTDAWDALRMFAEPDSSEIYTRIEMVGYNWATREETPMAALEFTPAADTEDLDEHIPCSTAGDYSPADPWDAPGMNIRDFI